MLKWTKEPPTKEGWYFVREGTQVAIRRVVRYCDGLVAVFGPVRQSVEFLARIGAMFAGPIEEPEEPEE